MGGPSPSHRTFNEFYTGANYQKRLIGGRASFYLVSSLDIQVALLLVSSQLALDVTYEPFPRSMGSVTSHSVQTRPAGFVTWLSVRRFGQTRKIHVGIHAFRRFLMGLN